MSKETKAIHKGKFLIKSIQELFDFLKTIDSDNFSFALYRLPGKGMEIEFSGSWKPLTTLEEIDLENIKKGYIMSPFNGKSLFLKADITWNSKSGFVDFDGNIPPGKTQIEELLKTGSPDSFSGEKQNNIYEHLVTSSVSEIDKGTIRKLVPANRKSINIDVREKLPEYFGKLCEKYPNAFVSLISSTQTGTWIGASPEILVEINENQFKTVSVAGTQPYNGQTLSQVAWTQKEIEEQALVSRYIINCFKKIRLREFDEYGPKTVIAGNLLHLKTNFTVNMQETNFPELGSVMLKLLHPTSAVCGMPLNEAREFLIKNENFDRKLFSGFLGPVDRSNSSLFVNIRCMEVHNSSVTLYAGAGVTTDSIPEKECAETKQKFATLENIILENESSASH